MSTTADTGHGTTISETQPDSWLVALDVDGTVMREDGIITEPVIDAIRAADAAGHEVMLATGRSEAITVPVLDTLDIAPRFLVCANGALTLERDNAAQNGYRRVHVETFDPTDVLQTIRGVLADAAFGVENETGHYRLAGPFPDGIGSGDTERVEFDDLLGVMATRVVVISPGHGLDEFLEIVNGMGLHKVSYTVGWTAWLDIAPEGVTKATALERVRAWLGVPRDHVLAAGDGRNDIDMLRWAGESGRAVAMGQAPEDVRAVATEIRGGIHDDGLAEALKTLPLHSTQGKRA